MHCIACAPDGSQGWYAHVRVTACVRRPEQARESSGAATGEDVNKLRRELAHVTRLAGACARV